MYEPPIKEIMISPQPDMCVRKAQIHRAKTQNGTTTEHKNHKNHN
jgi:hypothetical protein